MSDIIELTYRILQADCPKKTSLLLSEKTGLSQAKIKALMQKGGVWLLRGKTKQRLRRASKKLLEGDELALFYDPDILQRRVPEPQLVHDAGEYSIWFKPFGLSCQGSRWGDFSSIHRWVEVNYMSAHAQQRPVHLVHRLDKATSGLLLLAHSKNSARLFSEMFAAHQLDKRYQAIVEGNAQQLLAHWTPVTAKVDGKSAKTELQYVASNGLHSLVDVRLHSGRKHQIRQHLASIGLPILGDRLYGSAEKNTVDLQLQAQSLRFICPFSEQECFFQINDEQRLKLSIEK